MKYKNKTISLSKLIITPKGVATSLCNSCLSMDCSHPVEYQNVSLFGVTTKMRCLMSHGDPTMVIDCEGYTK